MANRKTLVWNIIISCLLMACNKDVDPSNNQNFTEILTNSPVSSKLMVYMVGNNQSPDLYSIHLDGTILTYNNTYKGFNSTSAKLLDKYSSNFLIMPSDLRYDGYIPQKTFTASGASKNYVNVEILPLVSISAGYLESGTQTLSLPNNGQLELPPFSLGIRSSPAYHSVLAGFTAPTLTDYAVHLPCYPMADENGKRSFLNSYGVYLLSPKSSDYSDFNIDFDPEIDTKLRMPVPTNLPGAPDSIPVYNINDKHLWERNGFAVRVGNFYEKKVTKKGYWNFAVPVNGVYVSFQLQSSVGIAVPNVRYVIKNGAAEVAEGRTNANGDGLVFIPTNKDLTIDLIYDYPVGNGSNIQGLAFGNFNKASDIKVSLPANREIITLQGSVYDCNGKIVSSGEVALQSDPSNDEYRFPIINGKFSAARWIGTSGYIPETISIDPNSSNFSQPFVINSTWSGSFDYLFNYEARFYSCKNSTQLYCNYRIDNQSFSIEGNTALASPELNTSPVNPPDIRFNFNNNGKGLSFNAWLGVGNTFLSYTKNITVDGTLVELDDFVGERTSEIYLYRDDNVPGGIREGWFNIYYKEANGAKHNITGNFRIKIN